MDVELFRFSVSTELEMFARLAVAALVGGIIGFERRQRDRPAGVRTLSLVSMGAAVFTLVSIFGFVGAGDRAITDPSRVAAQVATGVGFIGAGTILRSGAAVHGLTTATGIWVAAALGMAAGAGMYILSVAGAVLTLVILVLFPRRRDTGDGSDGR